MTPHPTSLPKSPSSRVVELCASLIRFDTTNHGGGTSTGEHLIARFIADLLTDAGYDPQVLGPMPERASIVLRVPGVDPSLPGLLVHGHTDVVPADAADWSTPPFAGLIADGYVWGRGAVDMKDTVATMLATLLSWAESGVRPRRDILFIFVADEEDKGEYGALWLAEHHPSLFAGIEAAIGESGGEPLELTHEAGHPVRVYRVASAERGTLHVRLHASGRAGHGSRPTDDNAVVAVIDAAHRVAHHRWPLHLSATVTAYLEQSNAAVGAAVDLSTEAGVTAAIDRLGHAGEVARVTVRGSATPTMLTAGYKVNVIPGTATAELDVRCPPGYQDEMLAELDRLLGPGVSYEFTSFQSALEVPIESSWFESMRASILRFDPEGIVVPYCMGGGTDAKAFSALGITCYGFSPRSADPDGREPVGMHGVDERVPVASLIGGHLMLEDFLTNV